ELSKKQNERQVKKDKLLDINLKTKKWIFIILLINLIITILVNLISNQIGKKYKNPRIDQLEKIQLELSKDLDSLKNQIQVKPILNQPKK
ncbi:hypothetical protein, partial [Polaribacter sp. IC066]|uniref:hypothetical protein n=1 Tax=Polaribacter sp. IC066 TaxID=57032 RepID=UPI001CC20726